MKTVTLLFTLMVCGISQPGVGTDLTTPEERLATVGYVLPNVADEVEVQIKNSDSKHISIGNVSVTKKETEISLQEAEKMAEECSLKLLACLKLKEGGLSNIVTYEALKLLVHTKPAFKKDQLDLIRKAAAILDKAFGGVPNESKLCVSAYESSAEAKITLEAVFLRR